MEAVQADPFPRMTPSPPRPSPSPSSSLECEAIEKPTATAKTSKPQLGRAVPKHAKITILKIYYSVSKPSWSDELPIGVNGKVWIFRPWSFLDDVAENWLGGSPGVKLSEEEKRALASLPWVEPWIERLGSKRERRAKRKREDAGRAGDGPKIDVIDVQ
jgi:hypothetical protein